MIIKKIDSDLEIILDKTKIYVDPSKPKFGYINILSNPEKNLNTNKFFNMPGEYEAEGIYLKGYQNNKQLVFVFNFNGINSIYLTEDLTEKTGKLILDEWQEINIALIKNKINSLDKIKNKLKFKLIVDIENKNNLRGEKAKEIKINIKKLDEKNIILT
ncbi:MAG: hypothetical protein KatS3mg095_0293 [Candidatus Parcubacteria bacterium]|nr:MAG: hypothetical protein KatS3mg095_0293 [Candidatus Parcubacteria bacterium]